MTLKDHFAEPFVVDMPWDGFHSLWLAMMAVELNRILPQGMRAIPMTRGVHGVEIDLTTLQFAATATPDRNAWQPESPVVSPVFELPDRNHFEIRIVERKGTSKLLGVIELASPSNKDRPSERQMFAGKCAHFLRSGVGLLVVDIVTERSGSLHDLILEMLELDPPQLPSPIRHDSLYAVAYRTIPAEDLIPDRKRLEMWPHVLEIGGELPTLPLWLAGELAVPVELAKSYTAACESLRIE